MRKVRSRLPLSIRALSVLISYFAAAWICEAGGKRQAFSDQSLNLGSNSWNSPMFLTKAALALWSFVEACSLLFLGRSSSSSIGLDEEEFDG